MIPDKMAKKQDRVIPTVNLPAPEAIKLYLEGGRTVDYMPVDLTFQLDRATGVALLCWNRPDNLNALTSVLVQEHLFAVEHITRDADIRAAVFTAKGRAFSAGMGVKPRTGAPVTYPEGTEAAYRSLGLWWDRENDYSMKSFTLAHWNCPKICIGAINGLTVGGAANIALAGYFDFVYTADSARYVYPFTKLGITPELGSSLVMPFLVGMVKAKELLLGGEWFGSEDALKLGLVNKVVPLAQLVPESLQLAAKYSTNPKQEAIRRGKELLNRRLRVQLDSVLDAEGVEMKECFKTSDPFGARL